MSRSHFAFAAVAAAAVVVAGAIGLAAVISGQVPGPVGTSPMSAESAAPALRPSLTTTTKPRGKPTDPLTGGKVSQNEVIAAKVENIAAARPQVGLNQADITFVQEVEGAQTRLIAVFHSRFPRRLGPIRSARSTDVQLLPLFGKPGLVYSEPIDRSSARSIMPRSCRSNGPLATVGG